MDTPTPPVDGSASPASSATPKYDALSKTEAAWLEAYFAAGMNQTAASRRLDPKRTTVAAEKHGARMSGNVGVKAAIAERLAALRIEANDVLYRIDQRARASGEDFLTFETVQCREDVWVPIHVAIAQLQEEVDEGRIVAERLGLEGKALAAHDEEMDAIERRIVRYEVRAERRPDALVRMPGPVTAHVRARLDLAAMRDAGKLHLLKSVKRDKDGGFTVELHDAAHADDVLAKHLGLLTERVDLTTGGEPLKEIRVSIAPPKRRGDSGAPPPRP